MRKKSFGIEFARVLTACRILLLLTVALLFVGCAGMSPAEVPSNQPTPIVWNGDTRDVLMNASDKDIQVLASALESQAESGSVIYVDHQGWVYRPDGTLFTDANGNPVKVRTKVIAKLNSLKELQAMRGVSAVTYRVGGYEYVKDLPEQLKGKDMSPEVLYLKIDGITEMNAVDTSPEMRRAAGEERAAILAGMSQLATARGAAFAAKVESIGNGLVKVITATGKEIIGRVNGTTFIENGIAGATDVIEARLKDSADNEVKVVAEGDNSKELRAATPAP